MSENFHPVTDGNRGGDLQTNICQSLEYSVEEEKEGLLEQEEPKTSQEGTNSIDPDSQGLTDSG